MASSPLPASDANSPERLTLIRPDDWHVHLRDGAMMRDVLQDTARQFGRAIVMPNLKPPVTTTAQAVSYRQRIMDALPGGSRFDPLMTLYLTNDTTADEIVRARASGVVHGVKLYPAGATTNSAAGVSDLSKCMQVLATMQEVGMPLLVHGEVTDPVIDIFDREAVFIDRVLAPLRRDLPGLKIVFEHITTSDAAHYVAQSDGPIAATITAHHLLYNRNELFKGGINPHYYCLPVLKREWHRLALVEAATSGSPRFFLGTDSAPHTRESKEAACGCAGCYTALHAMELYAKVFDQVGKLDKLEGFASLHGPAFYGLPKNTETITLVRKAWSIPSELHVGGSAVVPLDGGSVLEWQLA
ncbi:MAG: dihydroorotase [Herminiimonas sp.]|nr:dihydroorotase [Herminiimonas sp.]